MAKLTIGKKTYIGSANDIARLSGKSVSEVQTLLGGGNSNTGSKNTTSTNKPTTSISGSSGGSHNTTAGSAISRDGLGSTKQYTGSNNSQYTGIGTHNDANVSQWAKNQINYYKDQYNNAIARGDTKAAEEAHLAAEAIRAKYGYSGGADGSQYIALPDDSFEYIEEKPEYESKYDPQIDALLKEILNRDDFSYDVANDPLYQQYANMYRREGDRAMKETMAEAAASAGGMNTYAMTAAMQANNYYNSQLNDKIPQLYQLAYEMYLQDKESKVQDLGLLRQMDATQYGRYRDTMNDFKDDRSFAYGLYRDDVADSQWKQTFDNNNYWANKEFDYNVGRDTIADGRYEDETSYNRNQYDQESAKAEVEYWIKNGIMPDDDLIAKSGMNKANIEMRVAQVKSELTGGDPNTKYVYIDPDKDPDNDPDLTPTEEEETTEDISVEDAVATLLKTKGKGEAFAYLKDALSTGAIQQGPYMMLYAKYFS